MKKFAVRASIVIAAMLGLAAQAARAQVNVNVTIGGFYDELSPYGRWVDCQYGQCWLPGNVAADWQPYSNGQWISTEYGWTWVSNDPWGGNPYHYGTWASIPGYGWSWVPGTVWAPAWVTWSYSNNYVGWAPLPPTVVFGASGYSGSPIVVSRAQYVFVPTNRFVGMNVTSVRIPAQQSAEIFRQTRPVTGFAVSGGIVRNTALPMETIQRATGSRIETRSIQTAGTAPRAVSAGSAHLSVVAPPREVKAAVAGRPQAVSRTVEISKEQKHVNAPVDRQSASATASKAHEPPPGQPAESLAARPQAPRPKPEAGQQADHASKPKPRAVKEKPPEKSHGQPAEAPTTHGQAPPPRPEAGRPAEQGSRPKAQSGNEKPVENDKKPDGEKP